jgi:hypothetical protein
MSKLNIDLSAQVRDFKKGHNQQSSYNNGTPLDLPFVLDERVTQLESLKVMNELTLQNLDDRTKTLKLIVRILNNEVYYLD